jgi:NAD(P)-dependent dehydrogenase (short-subunit alcohol dehydrogenase family)
LFRNSHLQNWSIAMDLSTATAVVTGANRGLGREFATQLLAAGAKVYAAARRPEEVDLPGAVPIELDITDAESVRRAAQAAPDVTLLVNNAGISTHATLLDGSVDDIRREMETHYFGTLSVTRAFAPLIERNGGGAVLNVLSVLSWAHLPAYGGYSAAKAAAWAMTNALRAELEPRGVAVSALHVAYMATEMAAYVPDDQKTDPAVVARLALAGVAGGEPEIIADELSRTVKAALSAPVARPA